MNIEPQNIKTNYNVGDGLDLSNSSLLVYYSDNTNKRVNIDASMIGGFKTTSEGSYTYTITYQGYSISINYIVNKKVPTYSIPILDMVEYGEGMILADIFLPSGFTWNHPNTLLSLGEFEYEVTYTPNDTNMYYIVNNIMVAVTIVRKMTSIIIYEVYGGGGNVNAIYNQDYVVLYNNTNQNIDLSSYSLQYSAATQNTYSVHALSGIIAKKSYYVIALEKGSNGVDLPVKNLEFTLILSATQGKIALVKSLDLITSKSDENVIDFIGYGGANEYEEVAASTANNQKSLKRTSVIDTNHNLNDFNLVTPDLSYVVTAINLIGIRVNGLREYYQLHAALDIQGATITKIYDNGYEETQPLTVDLISGFDSSTIGSRYLKISFEGIEVEKEYHIIDYIIVDQTYVYYIDLGETGGSPGEAALIKYRDIEILVDAGEQDTNSTNELMNFLSTKVVDGKIEYVIATHPDSDHIGGMKKVFEGYEIEHVIQYSTGGTGTTLRQNYEEIVRQEGSSIFYIQSLVDANPYLYIDDNPNIYLQFFETGYLSSSNTNASSIVFTLNVYGTKLLFNGDAEGSQEANYAPLVGDIDILKMGHHGSKNGTTDNLLTQTKPEVVIVNNGDFLGNKHSHPTYDAVSKVYQYSNLTRVFAVTGGNKLTTSRMEERNGDIAVSIGDRGYHIESKYYGNNPIELSKTAYWNDSSNPSRDLGYYYKEITGITFTKAVKQLLHDIIDDHTAHSYDFATTALRKTDEDPNNPNNLILFYTGRSQGKDTNGASGNKWNREHVWAKSHGGFGESKPAGTDLHHLRPTDAQVNSIRGSKDFANGGTKVESIYGVGSHFCYTTDSSFEPRDEVKGDVARILFYMAVRYEGDVSGEPDLELNDLLNNGKNPYMGRLSILLEWHKNDPVDDFERNRNQVIYSYQGNRNPFIDHPELANIIFK